LNYIKYSDIFRGEQLISSTHAIALFYNPAKHDPGIKAAVFPFLIVSQFSIKYPPREKSRISWDFLSPVRVEA
jgi:hypothetical protein